MKFVGYQVPVLDGLLDSYVSQQPIQAKWMSITPTSGTSGVFSSGNCVTLFNGSEDRPGMRGGHQMCMDPDRGLFHLWIKYTLLSSTCSSACLIYTVHTQRQSTCLEGGMVLLTFATSGSFQ